MKIRLYTSIKHAMAIVFAVAAVVDSASADNSQSANGGSCKPYFGSQAGDFSYGADGIFNQTTSNRLITCPVLVDEVFNTAGTNGVYLHWQAAAAYPNDTIRCTLWSRFGTGAPRQATAGNLTGSGWVHFGNVANDDILGSYTITCTLPRLGKVNTVWVREKS